MVIRQLSAKNFKGFRSFDLDLKGRSTAFFGVNGTGKSTVLSVINFLFWTWVSKLNPSQGVAYRSFNAQMVRVGSTEMTLSGTISLNDHEYFLSRSYKKQKLGKNASSIISKKQYEMFVENFTNEYLQESADMPVFVNYGTNRSVLDIPLRIRKKHDFSKITAFERAIENKLDFRTFFEWFRSQEDLENEQKVEQGDLGYEDKALKCVRTAIGAMLDNVSSLHIRRNPLRMVVKKDGLELRVDQLSDGEKCTLALFGDLARRIALANPSMSNPLEGKGVVLIDEIELHMHPSWQRVVLRTLKKTFPNIQFIITTHSPQVLSELDDSYAIFSLSSDTEDGNLTTPVRRMDGCDSNYILEEYMQTSSKNVSYAELVNNAYHAIYRNEFTMAERYIDRVRQISGDNSIDMIHLEAALMRGKILYEKNHKGQHS